MNRPPARIERKGTYQGVPQWGITGSAELTPSRATAEKWARLENAERQRDDADARAELRRRWATNSLD